MALKAQIKVAATILIRRRGYENVTIRDVCEMLDISPGNYSYHFPRKPDLLQSILMDYRERELVWHESYFQNDPGIVTLLEHFEQFFREYDDHRQILRLHYHPNANVEAQPIKSVRREYYTLFLKTLVDAQQLNASEEDVIFLAAFIQFLVKSWSLDIACESDALQSHLYMLAQQLYYFCSENEQLAIGRFLEHLEADHSGETDL